MANLTLAQACFEGTTLRQRSPLFLEEWLPLLEQILDHYGKPPGDCALGEALFALPLVRKWILIGQVGQRSTHGPLLFRCLVVHRSLYDHLHDPFRIARQFPLPWDLLGEWPDLQWPTSEVPTRRTVPQLQQILKEGNSPFLLGATQTLVDTGKIILERSQPQPELLEQLWQLLPDSTRRSCWPATFCFSDQLPFDIRVMPQKPEQQLHGYLNEEQVLDYPDSRYERNLQIAVEGDDQRQLDRLLARRSSTETVWFAFEILVVFVLVGLLSQVFLFLQKG